MAIDKESYYDLDDLGLYLTLIESTVVTFNPIRTIEFNIIRPHDHSEKVLHYNSGTLSFKNVLYGDLRLLNEFYEYPEFYRSAVLENSKLLQDTIMKLNLMKKEIPEHLKHYYLYIDEGNSETEVNIICEAHEMTIGPDTKLLAEFNGFNE